MAQSEAEVARKTDTIMAQADKDGDGVVTFDGEKRYFVRTGASHVSLESVASHHQVARISDYSVAILLYSSRCYCVRASKPRFSTSLD